MINLENIALESSFLEYDINEPIKIYTGHFTIEVADDFFEILGEVKIAFLPKARLIFEGVISGNLSKLFEFEKAMKSNNMMINVPGFMKSEVLISGITDGSKGNKVSGILKRSILTSAETKVNRMEFTVVNFVNDLGRRIVHGRFKFSGRTKLKYKDWEIILDKRYDYSNKKIFDRLKNSGGYLITHVGYLKRVDDKLFDTKEVEPLISGLYWLLSFSAGRHVAIPTLEGYHNEEVIWSKYQVPLIDGWTNNITWFPKQKSPSLEHLFPKVIEKQEDPFWNKVLWEVLSWYSQAHSSSIVENKVVSVQVALETLAWVYLIVDRKSNISKSKYKYMNAAEKFREILSRFSIDLSIPKLFIDIKDNYDDGPHLFTVFRNKIVHPTRELDFDNPIDKLHVLYLGVWYLELLTLGILGYEGSYVNRLKVPIIEGVYEFVPWKTRDN